MHGDRRARILYPLGQQLSAVNGNIDSIYIYMILILVLVHLCFVIVTCRRRTRLQTA